MPRVAPAPPDDEQVTDGLAFPMWVMPIAKLLEIASSGQLLPPHEEVKRHMVEHRPGMRTIFFSHTW